MSKLCLDLFSGTGGFGQAFEDHDEWDVYRVEMNPRQDADLHRDVLHLEPDQLPNPDVILASPPCTYFSTAGNHDSWDNDRRPQTDDARRHVALVYHTMGLIKALSPDWWWLENPRGRLRWFLGNPSGTVTYCQYGKDYMKPTDLWGRHPPFFEYRSCSRGSDCHKSNTEDDGTSAIQSMPSNTGERAAVPEELSRSILEAVNKFPTDHPTLGGNHD